MYEHVLGLLASTVICTWWDPVHCNLHVMGSGPMCCIAVHCSSVTIRPDPFRSWSVLLTCCLSCCFQCVPCSLLPHLPDATPDSHTFYCQCTWDWFSSSAAVFKYSLLVHIALSYLTTDFKLWSCVWAPVPALGLWLWTVSGLWLCLLFGSLYFGFGLCFFICLVCECLYIAPFCPCSQAAVC